MAKKAKKGNGKAKVAGKPEQPQDAKKAKSGEPTRDQGSKPPGSGCRRPTQARARCQGKA